MEAQRRLPAEQIAAIGEFELIGRDRPQLPLVCFRLDGEHDYDEFDVAGQLAAERGWMVPAYTLPPDAESVTVLRALVKENVGHAAAETLVEDCRTPARCSRRSTACTSASASARTSTQASRRRAAAPEPPPAPRRPVLH